MLTHRALLAALLLAIPVTADRCIYFDDTFAPGDLGNGDSFGWSVTVEETLAAVGAPLHDGHGAVYVYRQDSSGAWVEETKLEAADPEAGDFFGQSVGVFGDTLVVGAYQEDEGAMNAGAVYVFEFAAGAWTQSQKLLSGDPQLNGYFGNSVALEGDTLAIGAHRVDGVGDDEGAVYVFERAGGIWSESQKLVASDASDFDLLGRDVAISGDVLVAGAHLDAGAGTAAGSAYVFERAVGTWAEAQKLIASDSTAGDRFGHAVDVDGTRLVVGAYEDDSSGSAIGSVYVFEEVAGIWTEIEEIEPSDGAILDAFGRDVALFGDVLVVGSANHDSIANDGGAAYVFRFDGTSFVQDVKLTEVIADGDQLGFAVAVDLDDIFVSALDGGANDTGNLRVWRIGIAIDTIGNGTPGSGGFVPTLASNDCFGLGSSGTIRLGDTVGGSVGAFLLGNSLIFFPFFGGVIYTQAINTIPLVLTGTPGSAGAGSFDFPISLTPTLPSGVSFILQAGVLDTGAFSNIALSNAVRMQFP